MDLRRLLTTLRRWLWLLLAGAVLAGGAAYAVSAFAAPPPTYEARAVVLVGPALTSSDTNTGQLDAARRLSQIYVEVANARPLLERVVDELELDVSADALRAQLTVTTPLEPPIITVVATANDSFLAADIANEVVQQLISAAPDLGTAEQQAQEFIDRQVDALELEIESLIPQVESLAERTTRTPAQDERLAELQSRLANLRSTYAALVAASAPSSSNQFTLLEEATPPAQALPTGRAQAILFAAVLGVALALAVALLVEHLDDTIRSSDALERLTGLPNMAEIDRISPSERSARGQLPTLTAPYSAVGEGFRSLRIGIDLAAGDELRSLLVVSALRGEGKTSVTANLGVAFAQAGRQVLLVDGNLRQPGLHELFGVANDHGLNDVLSSTDESLIERAQQTEVPGLRLLPSGPPPANPAELIGSARMRDLLAERHESVDLVVVDGSTVLGAPETPSLAAMVDGTLVVVAEGRTSAEAVGEAHDTLRRARATILGTALNRIPATAPRRDARVPRPEGADLPRQAAREDQTGS